MKLYTLDNGIVINLDHISFITTISPDSPVSLSRLYHFRIQFIGSSYLTEHATYDRGMVERDALILAWRKNAERNSDSH